MSKITRRSFIKRTGAVTLGSTLGLGLLPSVTRKLYATDLSQFTVFGVIFQSEQLVYQDFFDYGPGQLEVGMVLNMEHPLGQCNIWSKCHIYRYATYREERSGVYYNGTTWDSIHATWECVRGVVKLKELWGHESGAVPVKNNLGQSVGSVWMEVTGTEDWLTHGMRCKAFAGGDWGMDVVPPTISYSVECCGIL